MIELRTQSLEDFQREILLDAGFTQEDNNTYVRVVKNVRGEWTRVNEGWQVQIDVIAGIKILD